MKKIKCKNCNGSGYVQIAPHTRGLKKCPYCEGTGKRYKRVYIPLKRNA